MTVRSVVPFWHDERVDLYERLSVAAGRPGKPPPPPEPSRPGTSLTASVETTDEDRTATVPGAFAP